MIRPPKILVLYASDRVSGPGRGLMQLVAGAGERASFTICNFDHPDRPLSDFTRALLDRGVKVDIIPQSASFDPAILPRALRLADAGGYDLVQSHGYKTHLLAWVIRATLGIPWMAVAHGWTAESRRVHLYNQLEKGLLRLPDTLAAVSPTLVDAISSWRPKRRTTMILNAIEESRFERDLGEIEAARASMRSRLGVSEEDFLVAVIGRLSHEKGQDLFLRAISSLKIRGCRVIGAIVGEGPTHSHLIDLARELQIDKDVRFTGFSPDVWRHFVASDLVCVPSRSEGLPNVVLEAHLLQRAVVAFDVGGVQETITDGETGWLVEPEDVEGLAQAIQQAVLHPDLVRDLRREARETLFPKFAVETRVKAFLEEYDRLRRK